MHRIGEVRVPSPLRSGPTKLLWGFMSLEGRVRTESGGIYPAGPLETASWLKGARHHGPPLAHGRTTAQRLASAREDRDGAAGRHGCLSASGPAGRCFGASSFHRCVGSVCAGSEICAGSKRAGRLQARDCQFVGRCGRRPAKGPGKSGHAIMRQWRSLGPGHGSGSPCLLLRACQKT
jgi:hypothetical protein